MKYLWLTIMPFLILFLTFVSVNQWSAIQIGNTLVNMTLAFTIIILSFLYYKQYYKTFTSPRFLAHKIYLILLIIAIARGIVVAENYWEWKQLVDGALTLCLPFLIFPFSNPTILHRVLNIWFKYAIFIFFLFFMWVTSPGSKHYFLGPLLLLGCFVPALNKKWGILFCLCIFLMLVGDIGARSQVIKAILAILFSLAFYFRKYINIRFLNITHWFFYILPIILLYLGISGTFNIFEDLSSEQGKYSKQRIVNGKVQEEDLAGDTRTFIYREVIGSALKHNYVLFGRTPARGNDSAQFGKAIAKELNTNKYERHSNEVCFPNIFTWMGLTGMIVYCVLYLIASFLSLYRSNNIYMKFIGIFIAVHFAFGWIEDFNRFDIYNISLWMAIAMGYSTRFRKLSDLEFKAWLKTLFSPRYPTVKLYYLWSRISSPNLTSKRLQSNIYK